MVNIPCENGTHWKTFMQDYDKMPLKILSVKCFTQNLLPCMRLIGAMKTFENICGYDRAREQTGD